MNAVDTNVLIYACDLAAGAKHNTAIALIEKLPNAVLVWQVVCEFLAASRKLESKGFTSEAAWDRLAELSTLFPIVSPSPACLSIARELHLHKRVAHWDAMLYAACIEAGVTTLYSEDVPGGVIDGLTIVNPFVG